MNRHQLANIIDRLVIPGKGILAADESITTIGKRFDSIGVENTAMQRQAYRTLLCTTPNLSDYISGVILFEETLMQTAQNGQRLPDILNQQAIVPGIKLDLGLEAFAPNSIEQQTRGLNSLTQRIQALDCTDIGFAKWRNVYHIDKQLPTKALIIHNAETLAQYAITCQKLGLIPIVEPEILMDGSHSIEQCLTVTTTVLQTVFEHLIHHGVALEFMLLKPNMVLPGKQTSQIVSPEQVAEKTIAALKATVPHQVPSINFLSGGQSAQMATQHLNAIQILGDHPWYISFSYGRALQEPCLNTWHGQPEKVSAAQEALYIRSKLNGLATQGRYLKSAEPSVH